VFVPAYSTQNILLLNNVKVFLKKKTLNAKLHESFSIHQASVSKRTMEIAVILLQYNKIKKV